MITPGDFDFRGQTVLVTGAASGIGAAIAHAFGAHGAALKLADRDSEGLATTASAIAADATRRDDDGPIPACATRVYEQSDTRSVLALAEWAGEIDVLANNAGIVAFGAVETQAPELVQQVIETNLIGPIVLANAVAAPMLSRGSGVIINTTSQLAFCGAPTRAIYASAKAGLAQFTRSAAAEWAPRGVRVAALAPGRTLTPLNAGVLSEPEQRARALEDIPLARFGDAEEMANLVVMLASGLGSYIVGHSLIADGGYVIAH